MSAIRSTRRSHKSSPYLRPQSQRREKSTWTIKGVLTKLWGAVNPPPTEDVRDESPELEYMTLDSPEPPDLAQAVEPPPPNNQHPSVPPPSPLPLTDSPSKTDNLLSIADFLQENNNKNITPETLTKLAQEIKRNAPAEERPRFRLSTPPSASPHRGNSPSNGWARSVSPDKKPRTLASNPNGSYVWYGGGSSKQEKRKAGSRNRYHSPAFGGTRATPERIVMRDDPASPGSDKRRRIDNVENPSDVAAPPRSPAPAPSPTRAALAASVSLPAPPSPTKTNGVTKPPQLNAARFAAPTAPAKPSPLRNGWSASASSAEDTSPPKQTKAASFMSQLITQATPPSRTDTINPYQHASPVHNLQKRNKRRPVPAKKPKTEEPIEKEEKEEKEFSAQAIIEATLPKGSKRSRPPADLTTPPAVSTGRTSPAKLRVVEIEEIEDEEDDSRASKRSKSDDSVPTQQGSDVASDAKKAAPPANPPPSAITGRAFNSGSVKTYNAPKEPSKLRYVFQPESSSPPVSVSATPAPLATPTPPSLKAIPQTTSQPASAKPFDLREWILSQPVESLPKFSFVAPPVPILSPELRRAKEAVAAIPLDDLPKFEWTRPAFTAATPLVVPRPPPEVAAAKPKITPFNWGATSLKPLAANGWKCSVCDVPNDLTADKCCSCETSRTAPSAPKMAVAPTPPESAATKPKITPFNWGATSLKPVTDGWKCSVCDVPNDVTADKCCSCETSR